MKNNQKINQIETEIQELQNMLTNYKQEITKYENTVSNLVQQVAELKETENKRNIK
ncbi:hypothetical protein [endosymbiont GvMRE of Glomus versiforme]|uniref:hypothetical protein n=1 Tax=endosymbiont GvMRE of Glomus versiforme TaxID=2039283 RepID=UPI000ED7DEEC|nr:hypothetical protein [endosymbiont GvMRE of Glomus versiforme]RHZ35672.1 hypothetical protein GvMRE_IIg23 [endosymbiont GvMRE of Glomus versiforme]